MDGGANLADTSLVCQVLVTALAPGKSMQATFRVPQPYGEHVQVFNDATPVSGASFFGQPPITFQYWPQRVRQEIVGGVLQQEVQFDSVTPVEVNGVPAGSGNRIVISPEGPDAAPVTTFSRNRVRVMQIDSVKVRLLLPHTLVSIAGAGTFGGTTDFTTGLTPRSAVLGDLNGDGNPDLVVANSNDLTVSVLLGNGSGSFGPKTDFPTGALPWSVAIGDMNGDGRPDLVVADRGDYELSVLPGNGSGGFGTRAVYPIALSPSAVAIVDMNGDGRPDVVVAGVGLFGTVSVLLGNGAGTLGAETDYPVGDDPVALAAGDVTGDAGPDIVVANSGSNTVSLLPGDGLGGFGSRTDFPTGSEPVSVALADIDRDGLPDLVVANHSGGTISALLGFGPGSFGPSTNIVVSGSPTAVAVADVNGDEYPDIAVANTSGGTNSILFGDGLGGVSSTMHLITGGQPNSVVLGDVNNDGVFDVVESDGVGSASVVLGQGGSISPPGTREFAASTSPLYTIAPHSGYVLANVLVDGVAKGPIGSYQFQNLKRQHTITARLTRTTAVGAPEDAQALALSVVQPNPSRGSTLQVQLALPAASPARLELLDIGGRRVIGREIGSLGPGLHTVSLSAAQQLRPGLYWIRLTQSSSQRTERVVVIE